MFRSFWNDPDFLQGSCHFGWVKLKSHLLLLCVSNFPKNCLCVQFPEKMETFDSSKEKLGHSDWDSLIQNYSTRDFALHQEKFLHGWMIWFQKKIACPKSKTFFLYCILPGRVDKVNLMYNIHLFLTICERMLFCPLHCLHIVVQCAMCMCHCWWLW